MWEGIIIKRKFKLGDYVGFYSEDSGAYEYGIIQDYDKKQKKYEVALCKNWERVFLSYNSLTFMPRKKLDYDDLKRLMRYEVSYRDFVTDIIPEGNYLVSDEPPYIYNLDDMTAMVNNLIKNDPDEKEFSDWLYFIFGEEFEYCFECSEEALYLNTSDHIKLGFSAPGNDSAMAEKVFGTFSRLCSGAVYGNNSSELRSKIELKLIAQDIVKYKAGKPFKEYLWSLYDKRDVCEALDKSKLGHLNESLICDVKEIVKELTEAGDPVALEALAYACYGGDNQVYTCDWVLSRDCLLKLYEMEKIDDLKRCYYANTLGYIFYYGRCNNGIPEYDKALKYFTVAAAGEIYEGMYKLADMYLNGYGIEKNKRAAFCLVNRVYQENLKLIRKGKFDCKFADAALRMGTLCRDGIANGDAYYYYTLADFAIRKRAVYEHYGDNKVFIGIQKELDLIRKENPLKKAETFSGSYIPFIVADLFEEHSCKVTVRKTKYGLSLKVKRLQKPGEDSVSKIFECLPDYGYCELIDSRSFKAVGVKNTDITGTVSFIADDYHVSGEFGEEYSHAEFYHHDETVFSFDVMKFNYTLKKKTENELKEYTFASVEFTPGGRTYDYICNLPDVKPGDKVIVKANGEEQEVEVCRIFCMSMCDMPLEIGRYKEVLRKCE